LLRCAILGALFFAAATPFITFAPQYYVAGEDITWIIAAAWLAVLGAAVGLGLAAAAGGIAWLIRRH